MGKLNLLFHSIRFIALVIQLLFLNKNMGKVQKQQAKKRNFGLNFIPKLRNINRLNC